VYHYQVTVQHITPRKRHTTVSWSWSSCYHSARTH